MVDELIVIPQQHGVTDNGQTGLVSLTFWPRLDSGQFLGQYDDWRDWPSELRALDIGVFIGGTDNSPGTRTNRFTVDRSVADTDMWRAVFPNPNVVGVNAFSFGQALDGNQQPRTYPQADAGRQLREIRRQLAQSPDPLTIGELDLGPDLGLPAQEVREYAAPPETPPTQPPLDVPDEFHVATATFRRHPHLCRLLGLTVELRLDLAGLRADGLIDPNSNAFPLMVATNWQVRGPGRRAAYPRVGSDEAFYPFTDSPFIRDRQLDLERTDVFDLDVGSLTTRVLEMVNSDAATDPANPAPAPGLATTAGVVLTWTGYGEYARTQAIRQQQIELALADHWTSQPLNDPVPGYELLYDDAAAYRVDVSGGPLGEAPLRSLHEREAPDGYQLSGGRALVPPPDEGWIGVAIVNDSGSQPPKVPEVIATFRGWSLAAPRLESTLDPATGAVAGPPQVPQPSGPVQFGVRYEVVPKTLTRLAFGYRYTMRVRMVDLAGNSIPNTEANAITFPQPLFHGRGAPVLAPTVARRVPAPDQPGDSLTTIVLTSRHNQPDTDAEVPPQDRMLFPAAGLPADWELVELPEDLHTAEGYQRFVSLDGKAVEDQLSTDPASGDPIADGTPAPVADYLRDPAIRGVRLSSLPTQPDAPLLADAQPGPGAQAELRLLAQRLVVHAGDQPPEVRGGEDAGIHVWNPKACIWDVEVSHSLDPAVAPRFQLFDELGNTVDGYIDGQHWLASRRTTIRLIHAIDIGRFPPGFPGEVTVDRPAGFNSTTVDFTTPVRCDVPATRALEFGGRWNETIDVASEGPPRLVRRTAVLATDDVSYDHDAKQVTGRGTHDFRDTKRRDVALSVDALSRFTPYFPAGTRDVRGSDEGPTAFVRMTVPNTAQPPPLGDVRVSSSSARGFRRGQGGRVLRVTSAVLRLSLPRPWFLSGADEMVGVLLSRIDPTGYSHIARDPVRDDDVPSALTLDNFPRAHARAEGLRVIDPASGQNLPVDVVGFRASYDPETDRWVADVEVETDAYMPYVRLVVARFQPESITSASGDDLTTHLSLPTVLPPHRIGTTREIVLTRGAEPGIVTVSASGPEHDGRPGVQGDPRFNEMAVTLQEEDPAVADELLRWSSTDTVVDMARTAGPEGTSWTADVTVPEGGPRRRLLVEEFEPVLRTDGSVDGTESVDQVLVQTLPLPGGRFAGAGREETAVLVSRQQYAFAGSAEVVVIARRDNFADGLAGAPLAAALGGPLLLTATADLHPSTAAEIQRALPQGQPVYVLGGTAAISNDAVIAIEDLGYSVIRLAGAYRNLTAVRIAEQLPTVNTVFLTTAGDFPDALASGPAAIATGGAILLTGDGEPNPDTDAFLASVPDATRYAVGGQAAAAYPDAIPLVGTGREVTAVRVAETFFTDADVVGVARSDNFADALTGGVLMGLAGGAMLLTPADFLHPEPQAYLQARASQLTAAYIFGGSAAISDTVEQAVEDAIS